jgi:hypothetical protein
LDQFLQHLIDVKIKSIIRIGGKSRSKSLEGYNLSVMERWAAKTENESTMLGSTYAKLEAQRNRLGGRLANLHLLRKGVSRRSLEKYLTQAHPRTWAQLSSDQDDHFTLVGDPIQLWLGQNWRRPRRVTQGAVNSTPDELRRLQLQADDDIESLNQEERHLLHESWKSAIVEQQSARMAEDLQFIENSRNLIDHVHREVSRRLLTRASVIGITTTGLAKNISMLRRLGCKVILCEEAAEVLEAHLISALMPGVEHFIQIGDHQQLRPQISSNALGMESPGGEPYQLDRSQFERLALGQPGLAPLPVAQLNVQRRMRPEISRLIRETMYPRLEDHDSVRQLPGVVGMRENVYWLTHNQPEDVADEDTRLKSHGNAWEVGMVAALVRHLIRQGVYKSTDIAVLTPYARQLQQLRSALSRDFEVLLEEKDEDILQDLEASLMRMLIGNDEPEPILQRKKLVDTIRLATVDNFQGEEAKVIVVSLVRSNSRRKVGFLRTPNRINVLLSRAQHGMYLIGNADTYGNVPMWVEVRRMLDEAGALGTALELQCPRHPETPIRCSEAEHFARFSPDGGCHLPCNRRLEGCGHQCPAMCHSDTLHAAFACVQPCPRIRATCEHICPKVCSEKCGPCVTAVTDVQLPCAHTIPKLACYKTPRLDKVRCDVPVTKTAVGCGHSVEVACATDVAAATFKCPTPCPEILPCGHTCPGSCGGCPRSDNGKVKHKDCSQVCRRRRDTCEHICQSKCHSGTPCEPCPRRCEVSEHTIVFEGIS